jgi:dTDP-4-amino-4,6-dideoxygalactose transaminase
MSSRFSSTFHSIAPFDNPRPVGQLYFPSWERYEAAMREVLESQWYNNEGPKFQEFEEKLASFLGVKHALCMGSATFGLMAVIEALNLKGRILVPSFSFVATAQAVTRCGATPIFCDIDYPTHHICPVKLEEHLVKIEGIEAILAVNLWGGLANIGELERLAAAYKIPLIFDSAQGFGCEHRGVRIGGFGDAEVFSFHATKVLSTAEGGCIATNNDELAARIRGIRPGYGDRPIIQPFRVLNSRMSEAQAAVGLLSLEDFHSNASRNRSLFEAYAQELDVVEGVNLVRQETEVTSNYSYAVCEVDEESYGLSRDELIALLATKNVIARRYFHPPTHRTVEFENASISDGADLAKTEFLTKRCIQLPLGAPVNLDDVKLIAELVRLAPTTGRQSLVSIEGDR